MNILSARYASDDKEVILANIDGTDYFIPKNPGNSYYQQILAWVEAGGVIDPYQPPEPEIPDEISRRQFFQYLGLSGMITMEQSLAALQSGVVPPPLQEIIDMLPTEVERFNATMTIIGAQTFNRNHHLAEIVRAALGWTEEQRDEFWFNAYQL